MFLELVLLSYEAESSENCDNKGPCCFSCPIFDHCEQHDSSED